jgi:hypothetical protein
MDEDFEFFLENMGPEVNRREVPAASIEYFRGRLPNRLLAYWQRYGWCGYAEGLFWTINPQEYEPVLEAWIAETPFMQQDAYHIIARSAFGALLFWGERSGFTLKIFAPGSYAVPKSKVPSADRLEAYAGYFFSIQDRKSFDFAALFAPALKKPGPPKHDEMYGFVPALALGGPATLEHLQKVKAVEHLVLLAQLSELRVMEMPAT